MSEILFLEKHERYRALDEIENRIFNMVKDKYLFDIVIILDIKSYYRY